MERRKRELSESGHERPRRGDCWINLSWHPDGTGLPLPYRLLGWAFEAPPRGHQGFLAHLIIFIFMTRLVNKTSELATHIYFSRSSSVKLRWGREGGGLARH